MEEIRIRSFADDDVTRAVTRKGMWQKFRGADRQGHKKRKLSESYQQWTATRDVALGPRPQQHFGGRWAPTRRQASAEGGGGSRREPANA